MVFPLAIAPYVSARVRARIVIILLAAGSLIALLSVFVAIGACFLPTTDLARLGEDPFGLVVLLATFGLLLIQALLYAATAVFFLMFIYRAHQNLPALGTPTNRLQYSSGWMVGSFFVPFASLVIPYRSVKELWQRSQPVPDNVPGVFGYQPDPPAYFAAWWFFWILANVGDNIFYRSGDLAGQQNSLPIPWLGAIAHALEICAALCLIPVVISIDKRQAESWAHTGEQLAAGPPPPPRFSSEDG